MRNYKIGNLNITAPDDKRIAAIAKIIQSNPSECPRRIIFLSKSGKEPIVIDLSIDDSFEVYVVNNNSIDYSGSLMGGTGQKLLQSALDGMSGSQKQAAKIEYYRKRANIAVKHSDDRERIKEFESIVPDSIKDLYNEIMVNIGATTEAYKIDIIDQINSKDVCVNGDNWIPILNWFKKNVLSDEDKTPIEEKRTHYQLRAAFVTTVVRMVAGDARHTNSMRLARQVNQDFDWSKYAEEKQD
ncbi:MAG: hypothetical protein CMB80_01275 [Flammeovirgaceae bacterium]|nr:hypothetical protein [Flammeovirgaceae bacterium]